MTVLTWITIVALVLGAFGFISVSNIIQAINNKIEERGVEKIVDEIKKQFIDQYHNTIVQETTALLIPKTEEKIEIAIMELLNEIKKAERKVSSSVSLGDALEKSYDKYQYYVVVGSSPRRSDLIKEKEKILNQLGDSLEDLGLPNLIITEPLDDNPNWGLRFEIALSYSEAKRLLEKAIKHGFRSDSYLYRIKEIP